MLKLLVDPLLVRLNRKSRGSALRDKESSDCLRITRQSHLCLLTASVPLARVALHGESKAFKRSDWL